MPKDGWKPGRIYRVVLQSDIRDLFGNQRKQPVELVFSTGPEIPPTALAGLAYDRITGRPLSGARAAARLDSDSLTYVTVTDSAGFYAFRHLPTGKYDVTLFQDQNRNRKADAREPHAVVTGVLKGTSDTVAVGAAWLLAGDTTPARLTKADVRDSLQIRLTFDDHLDVTQPLAGAGAQLWRLPDSTRLQVAGLYYPKTYEAQQRRAQQAAAAAKAAQAAKAGKPGADSAAASAQPPKPVPADTSTLPVQELVLVPAQPLPPKTKIRIIVTGITNINMVRDGGGTQVVETPAPPAKPTVDSTKARADSTKARPDTTKAGAAKKPAADTMKPRPDTTKASTPPPATTPAKPPAPAAKPAASPAKPAPTPPDTTHG